jgi:hypothetical protein
MATNPNWPLVVTGVAFSTDPFDSGATPNFVDISERVQTLDTSTGRQYELDTVQAAECAITVLDADEIFNPANTSSPYSPNVRVYRRLIDVAMWPLAPNTGGVATNLLNTTTSGGFNPSNTTISLDPSFEVYAVDAGWGKSINTSANIISSYYP